MTATAPVSARQIRRARRIRWGVRVVAVTAGVFSLLTAVLLVLACFINDQRIDRDMGSATAFVTEVADRRAAVEFDAGGGTDRAGTTATVQLRPETRTRSGFARRNSTCTRCPSTSPVG